MPNNSLLEALDEIRTSLDLKEANTHETENGVVDIMTFCYDPSFLTLDFKLYQSQEIVLKAMYMGTVGNKQTRLTPEDWAWLEANSAYGDNKISLEKIRRREAHREDPEYRFTELTLVLGRRSGKTMMSSIIACYEAYKLLVINNGNPQGYYGDPQDKQYFILNVATSQQQAGELFHEIKARLANSPFFQGRIEHDTDSMVRLMTDRDILRRVENTNNVTLQGSVVIQCGHRNPKSLRGKAAICVIFDELAFYDEGKKVSGVEFYNALKPSVAKFAKKNEGMLVEISSPGPRNGIFYKRAEVGMDMESSTMMFRMPTWIFNPDMPETNKFLAEDKVRSPEMYAIEYGAEWPGGGVVCSYFPEMLIDRAVQAGAANGVFGEEHEPRMNAEYYAHIDPAISGDNYAIVVIRKEMYRDKIGAICPRAVLAKVKIWRPDKELGLPLLEIESEVVSICQRYHVSSLSFDRFPSISTLAVLRRNGINTIQTTFNHGYKNKIFTNLKDLMIKEECGLYLYQDPDLIRELKTLMQKPLQHGMWIGAEKNEKRGEKNTDDAADCLAGAVFMICGNHYQRWPGAILAYGLRIV